MNALPNDEDLARIELLPPEQRAEALEELEARLRAAMDEDTLTE